MLKELKGRIYGIISLDSKIPADFQNCKQLTNFALLTYLLSNLAAQEKIKEYWRRHGRKIVRAVVLEVR